MGDGAPRQRRPTRANSLIDPTVFRGLITTRTRHLIRLVHALERHPMGEEILTRPLLGALLSEAAQSEELLDAYGARNNLHWAPLRSSISGLKLFSDAGYKLIHILHATPKYRLLPVEGDFDADTRAALQRTGDILLLLATDAAELARRLGLPAPGDLPDPADFSEALPEGYLPHDRTTRHTENAGEIVAELATAFLDLAAASDLLHAPHRCETDADYAGCVPDPISERALRHIEEEFHSLQSTYDTYVSDTDTEDQDGDLKVLRGHVSVIYHLLQVATGLCHYYERHLSERDTNTVRVMRLRVQPRILLRMLMDYALAYASRYLDTGRQLCQEMLQRYASQGAITVPVPRYRGFHVRPSTLIAKIVRHYGSHVTMRLKEETYDAGAPLDLFRANEAINAEKRRRIAAEIPELLPRGECPPVDETLRAVQRIIHDLADAHKLVVYARPLPLDELTPDENETLAQFAIDEVARLLAMGKIDIRSEIKVTFEGDERVLADIRLLAEHGYGEDELGNNVPLPDKLRYLRR